jgi:type I restriction enzyme S subunit
VNLLVEQELDRLLTGSTGSVFPSLSAPTIKGFEIVRPSGETIHGFCSIAEPLVQLINAGARESAKLAALRDYLLPTLLSGTIRVKPAMP